MYSVQVNGERVSRSAWGRVAWDDFPCSWNRHASMNTLSLENSCHVCCKCGKILHECQLEVVQADQVLDSLVLRGLMHCTQDSSKPNCWIAAALPWAIRSQVFWVATCKAVWFLSGSICRQPSSYKLSVSI